MSYHFLQEQAGGCGQADSLDGTPFAPARLTGALGVSCLQDSETAASIASPYGTMYEPSPAMSGLDESISSQAGSPAKTFQLPVKEMDSTANDLPSGLRWHESLARFDPVTCLWKTAQPSLLEDWNGYSDRLPRWGLMHDGVLYPLQTPVLGTGGNASGYLPTPTANDERPWSGGELFTTSTGSVRARRSDGSSSYRGLLATVLPTPTVDDAANVTRKSGEYRSLTRAVYTEAHRLNPDWVEWLMGWPIGSTSAEPLPDAELSTWEKEPAIPRTTTVKVDKWSSRIKALGNGQVPQAMMLAWKVLQETKTP